MLLHGSPQKLNLSQSTLKLKTYQLQQIMPSLSCKHVPQRVLICSFDVLYIPGLGQQTQSTTTFANAKKKSFPHCTTTRRSNPPSIPFIFIYFYLKSNKTINLILLVLLGNEHTVRVRLVGRLLLFAAMRPCNQPCRYPHGLRSSDIIPS